MNKHLFDRQAGLLDQNAFSRLVYTRALRSLCSAPRLRFDRGGGGGKGGDDGCAHPEAGVNALAIERFEGRIMVSGGADGTIRIWDLEQTVVVDDEASEPVVRYATSASRPALVPVAEIPRASRTATAPTTPAPGHRFGVTHLSFYPFDAAAFLSSSFDHSLRLWATDTAQLAGVFDLGAKIYRHAVSPVADHLLVACATQHPAVRLVDLRSGAAVQSLVAPGQEAAAAVLAAAWSPSPQRPHVLASGAADGSVRLWDVRRASGLLAMLGGGGDDGGGAAGRAQAHAGPVNGLAWTDDGAFLVSAGHDRRLRVWDASSGANTLVSFGPAVRNGGGLASAPLVLSPTAPGSGGGGGSSGGPGHAAPDLLVWPNESEILVFGLHDGRTLTRLRGAGRLPLQRRGAGAGGGTTTAGDAPHRNRVTSLAWRGAGGLGSETGGAALGGRDGPAGGVLFSGHLDGHIRAWGPGAGWGGDDDGEESGGEGCFVDEGDSGGATGDAAAGEERARKRRALDQAYRSLMGTQITFR